MVAREPPRLLLNHSYDEPSSLVGRLRGFSTSLA